jgi:hypothetical protein
VAWRQLQHEAEPIAPPPPVLPLLAQVAVCM